MLWLLITAGQVTPAAGSADAHAKVVDQERYSCTLDTATMDAATVAQKAEEISKTSGAYLGHLLLLLNGNAAAAGNDYEAAKTVTLTAESGYSNPTPTPAQKSLPILLLPKEKKTKEKKAQLPTGEELW